jgi:transcriptional regulator with XRE-family HTH domain
MTTFKDRLKELRAAKGLSQRALADQIHISSSSIGMYESGQRQPDFETLEKIADFFNVDADFLLGRKDTTMRYVEVRPDGQPGEYYDDATVAKVAEMLRTNPEARATFDALSNMKQEDIDFVQKLIERMSD